MVKFSTILRRAMLGGVAALALGFALALSWLITRSLAKPLSHAIDVFGNISSGKYDNEIRKFNASATRPTKGAPVRLTNAVLYEELTGKRRAAVEGYIARKKSERDSEVLGVLSRLVAADDVADAD